MQFNKNKKEPFHRWYPFVEGYSKEFIQSIVKEMDRNNLVCLEPFSGSGTTALELQNCGIACFAFEVNPLMYLIARVKLENGYELERFEYWYDYIVKERRKKIVELETEFNTLYQGEGKKKWNYNTDIGIAVEKLRQVIESISEVIYKELFKVALAAILLDVSNLYRNGKCLSYKKKWEDRKIVEKDVFDKFDEKVLKELKCDIENSITRTKINNKERLYNQDSRIGIANEVDDNSIDLVITSPPYLNSRDYTDTYMLELKTLGFTKTSEEIKELREKTTLLNILQYAIIGPYTGKVKSRNWKDQQKLKRPMLDKNYFRNRMSNQSQQAEVKVVYSLGNDLYEVWHSLYEYKLKKVVVNGSEIIGTDSSYDAYEKKYFGQTGMELDEYLIDKYHRQIEKSSNFPHINSYILMITEMMFFTESSSKCNI